MFKEKEEFSRKDPGQNVIWKLAAIHWLIPIFLVFAGVFLTTQKFAKFMNYDPRVVGKPIFKICGILVYNPLVFLIGVFKYAFNDVYSYYFFKAVPPFLFCFMTAVLCFLVMGIFINAHQKNQHIHGTARYANVRDLKKAGHLQEHGIVCGELETARVYYNINPVKGNMVLHLHKNWLTKKTYAAPLICHSGSTNTWMIAPTRSGKGVSTIIPSCLNYGVPYWEYDKENREWIIKGRGSMVIFDPKGENWDVTAGYRSKFSVCMPFRPLDEKGDTVHYNPIHEIPDSPSQAFQWSDMIAEIFFGNEKNKSGGDGASEYFNSMARDIFSGVVMHVRFSKHIDWDEKNLSKVLDMFSMAKKEGDENSDESDGCGSAMFDEMRNSDHGNPMIHDLIVKAANRSDGQNPKERSSTFATVCSKISLFQDPLIKAATSYSDFSIDDFVDSENGISLYLIIPYSDITRIAPVFRMIITFMVKKFSSGTTNANAMKLKIPCTFLLDEFPVLGYFPDIALNAGILAGYGVTFFIVSQSLNQIKDIYGENHPFLDHCKTKIIYAAGNFNDANMFAQTIGNRSVLLDNLSSSGNRFELGMNSVSRSSQEQSVSLINADELMKLEYSRCIVMMEGFPPYKGKKVVYYEDPRFKDKQFLAVPSMDELMKDIKDLPSRKKRSKFRYIPIEEQIREIEKIEIEPLKYVPDVFTDFLNEDAGEDDVA